ncbi:MAG: 50S ribosomal protein L3 N(5)-glutamine methyltransferase [Chromatiales bacterium]|nr:50S ribosomal protein L3 N(5)-glutamine methyltransferase [Chromatiales bacterium]
MPADPALQTLRDFVRWGASLFEAKGLFYGHGTDNALDESYGLVVQALNLPFELPAIYLEAALTEAERERLHGLIARRANERIPVPYLVNKAWFCGLPFYVDERVLIPRSPIGELIEARFEAFVEPERVARILDIGTGSGCIAIACAHAFGHVQVDAVDISAEALDVARRNIQEHGVAERVRAIESDLFSALGDNRYDLIVSNPPYVDTQEMNDRPAEFRAEPALALEAGEDGLDIVRRLLAQAETHLSEDGLLIVEVGASQDALEDAFPEIPFLWLEFERGGEGVFLLSATQLREHRDGLR